MFRYRSWLLLNARTSLPRMRPANPDVADGGFRYAVFLGKLPQSFHAPLAADRLGLFGRELAGRPMPGADMRPVLAAVQHIFRWRLPIQMIWVHAKAVPARMCGLVNVGRRRPLRHLTHSSVRVSN